MGKASGHPEADLVVQHARVYTVALTIDEVKQGKREFPIIDDGGVAVKDGKIVFVGSARDAQAFIGGETEVIDASGKTLVPGFIDSHLHATEVGMYLKNLDFTRTASLDDMRALVAERACEKEPGEWLLGYAWNELAWGEGAAMPTRRDVDDLSPANPCYFVHISHHVALANKAALDAAGITRDTLDPAAGRIGRYPDGEPNGLLFEPSAMELVEAVAPKPADEDIVDAIKQAGKLLNSLGITAVIDPNHERLAKQYVIARDRGELTYRASLMLYLNAGEGDADRQCALMESEMAVTGFGDGLVSVNGVKILDDGIPAVFTAAMRDPYKLDPSTRGTSIWSQEDLVKMVRKAHELGWQVGVHAIGDRAADMVLAAYKDADGISPAFDRRHYLIHCPFPHEDMFDAMRELNIGVPVQPTIAAEMGEARMLHERLARNKDGAGIFLKNGIIAGGSSDAPVVSPDVIRGMYYAVTRKDAVGDFAFSEESKVSPVEALIMWTKNSAFFSHDDDKMGSIEVGNYGDLVILDRDFIAGEPEDIPCTKVEKTILGGRIVYSA